MQNSTIYVGNSSWTFCGRGLMLLYLHVPFCQDSDADLLFIIGAKNIHQVLPLGQDALADIVKDRSGLKDFVQVLLSENAAGML